MTDLEKRVRAALTKNGTCECSICLDNDQVARVLAMVAAERQPLEEALQLAARLECSFCRRDEDEGACKLCLARRAARRALGETP